MDGSNFDCVICQDKLNDAHETLCCHQCYCKQCINQWMGRNSTCPSCRKAITKNNIAQNVPMQRLVDNLPANCPNFQKGCRDKLTRGGINDHLNISCKYTVIHCPNNCGYTIYRYDTNRHLNSCSKRVVPCQYCRLNFESGKLNDHYNTDCQKNPRLCIHCRARVTLETIDEHLKKVCTMVIMKCPSSKFGCAFEGKRVDYNNHMIINAEYHVELAEYFFKQQNMQKYSPRK